MSQVEITVRGRHTAHQSPQRATAHLSIGLEGPREQPVHTGVAAAARAVTGRIEPLHDAERGPVTWWSVDQLRTWARRPFHSEGKQLPLVFHASTGVRATFSDFAVLSRWLAEVLQTEGVSVDRVEWALTAARQQQLTAEVRTAAVAEARSRAQAYADALGLGPVTAVALADAGMLGEGLQPQGPQQPAMFTRAVAQPGGAEISFEPEDVRVEAEVDARFVTG